MIYSAHLFALQRTGQGRIIRCKAMTALEAFDEGKSLVVEMRSFGGLSIEEQKCSRFQC